MNAIQAYILSKKYTKETAHEFGALKGAPATIKSITPSADNKYNTIEFEWENSAGDKRTSQMVVYNGNVTDVTQILDKGIKIATLTTIDGGAVDIYAPEGGSDAELQNNLTTSISVGGVPSGKAYAKGTPLEDIFAKWEHSD